MLDNVYKHERDLDISDNVYEHQRDLETKPI